LLFAGASRQVKSILDQSPLELLEENRDTLEPSQYSSLRIVLTDAKECVCF
jgi:hypothetical protein